MDMSEYDMGRKFETRELLVFLNNSISRENRVLGEYVRSKVKGKLTPIS